MSIYKRFAADTTRRLLSFARHKAALPLLALLALADSFVPLFPVEVFAIALMVVTPHRDIFVGVCFAISSALSAMILALLVLKVKGFAVQTNPELQATLEHGSPLISDWGPVALAMLSIFPDSPRASITVATVTNIAPGVIAFSVLLGKLVLYLVIVWLLRNTPRLIAAMRGSRWSFVSNMHPRLRKLAAFQRLMRR